MHVSPYILKMKLENLLILMDKFKENNLFYNNLKTNNSLCLFKIEKNYRDLEYSSVVENRLIMYEALGSNPSTTTKNNNIFLKKNL